MTIMNEQLQQSTTLLRDEERTRCEVWTRVMGYHRPVSEFNPGKQSEHAGRRHFREACADGQQHR